MSEKINRRSFLSKSLMMSAGTAAGMSYEEKALFAKSAGTSPTPLSQGPVTGLPMGKIGDLKISRIICGGNLISGFAHSRDLIYVSPFIKHYFTDEKVMDTFQLCEENGVNTAILRVDDHVIGILKKYRKERGGKIQWIAQAKPKDNDLEGDIKRAVDNGAVGVYAQGEVCDSFFKRDRIDLIGKAVDIIKDNKVIAGVGAHLLDVHVAVEKAGIDADFYMKTFNSGSYWTAGPRLEPDPDWTPTPQQIVQPEFHENHHDNIWATSPRQTIEFMAKVRKPWIAFKVLAAGAIHPRAGFKYAFGNGADFLTVGMFDFQVKEDVKIARDLLTNRLRRKRPWRG